MRNVSITGGGMQPIWLSDLAAKPISKGIWEIYITGFGPAEVGPYVDLRSFAKDQKGLEAHHIVAGEHLKMVVTGYTEANAPAVLLPTSLHQKVVSPRINAEQNYLGGRPRDGKAQATRSEILRLYREVYTWHTDFKELYAIAKSILN